RGGHRRPECGEQARLDEDLESVADAEDGLARSHEVDEVLRELGPQPRGEDRARPHVVSRREPARDHEEVVIVEVPTEFRGHVPGELLQVDPFGQCAEMPEERDGLVLAIRPLDEDDADPDRRALHVTTTCRGIVSPQAFRMTGRATDVHCRPFPRCSDVPPVVPRKVASVPSMRWPNFSYRSFRTSTSHRPFDSENSWTSHRIGSIAVVLRSAPRSARRAIGSTPGGGPWPFFWSRKYSDPPSSACVVPTRTTGSPDFLKSVVTQARKSSTKPTPKTTGVGGHGPSGDSL